MPAKKTRKPGKAVYLLSADRKYQRLSLKKISARVKGAPSSKRGRSIAKAVTAAEPSSPAHRDVAPAKVASVALVLSGIILVGSLVGASWTSSPAADAPAATVEKEDAGLLVADVASAPVVRPAPLTLTPPVEKVPEPARPAETPRPRVEIVPVPPIPALTSVPAEVQPAVAVPSVDTVTVTGCLDYDGKSAWLKNTAGIDAPRSRSWRSGFLKKSAPRIALVDGPGSVEAYDGRQVSVTGTLVDREMHVRSLKPIADNCE